MDWITSLFTTRWLSIAEKNDDQNRAEQMITDRSTSRSIVTSDGERWEGQASGSGVPGARWRRRHRYGAETGRELTSVLCEAVTSQALTCQTSAAATA